ncbi:hypothetical protein [Defluviimonas denitrificans]|uniref:hypothetical protein n=1 Tax=Albidovulum denitrificans TaxID=404881 RepID=UPI000CFBEB58|nr:hypothetical protein [Defluviimonas denitrificans]
MKPASRMTEALLTLANAIASANGISDEVLSGRILRKGGFFRRLAAGGDCHTQTAEFVLDRLAAMWPADMDWPAGIAKPNGDLAPVLPKVDAQALASVAHLPIWSNGRRPAWWHDLEVREFLIRSRRQMSTLRAAKVGRDRFGSRCPKKSAIGEFWLRLDKYDAAARHGAATKTGAA